MTHQLETARWDPLKSCLSLSENLRAKTTAPPVVFFAIRAIPFQLFGSGRAQLQFKLGVQSSFCPAHIYFNGKNCRRAPFTGPSSAADMASDEIVWQIINQQFCAFKLK